MLFGERMFGLDSQDRFPEDVPGIGMIKQEPVAKGNHGENEGAARCDGTAVVGHGCRCGGRLCFVVFFGGHKIVTTLKGSTPFVSHAFGQRDKGHKGCGGRREYKNHYQTAFPPS